MGQPFASFTHPLHTTNSWSHNTRIAVLRGKRSGSSLGWYPEWSAAVREHGPDAAVAGDRGQTLDCCCPYPTHRVGLGREVAADSPPGPWISHLGTRYPRRGEWWERERRPTGNGFNSILTVRGHAANQSSVIGCHLPRGTRDLVVVGFGHQVLSCAGYAVEALLLPPIVDRSGPTILFQGRTGCSGSLHRVRLCLRPPDGSGYASRPRRRRGSGSGWRSARSRLGWTRMIRDTMAKLTGCPFSLVQRPPDLSRQPHTNR